MVGDIVVLGEIIYFNTNWWNCTCAVKSLRTIFFSRANFARKNRTPYFNDCFGEVKSPSILFSQNLTEKNHFTAVCTCRKMATPG